MQVLRLLFTKIYIAFIQKMKEAFGGVLKSKTPETPKTPKTP